MQGLGKFWCWYTNLVHIYFRLLNYDLIVNLQSNLKNLYVEILSFYAKPIMENLHRAMGSGATVLYFPFGGLTATQNH